MAHLQNTLPRVLGILALLGSVPVLDLVPGIIYYRTTLISSLRCYLQHTDRFQGRWLARIANVILICFQPVPVLGALGCPHSAHQLLDLPVVAAAACLLPQHRSSN